MPAIPRSIIALLLMAAPAVAATRPAPGPDCGDCAHFEAPANPGPRLVIAPEGEPGDRLVLEGTIRAASGRAPAPGILLYAYHTNVKGIYPKRGGETGMARWHGSLRGWLRTGDEGRYRIETIRPAPYPGRSDPAHIHMTVTTPDGRERWVDDVVFDDDPLVDRGYRARVSNAGGSGIVLATRDARGAWHAVRDIVLPD